MMTGSFIVHLLILTLIAEFIDVRAYPWGSDSLIPYPSGGSQMSERFQIKQQSNKVNDPPGRPITRVKPVAVTCHESYMEIAIKVDLFELGLPVDASELRLGVDSQLIPACKVTAFSSNEFIIAAELTDCGTQHWFVTDSNGIFNSILRTGLSTTCLKIHAHHGVIRMENAVIPIECHYSSYLNVRKQYTVAKNNSPRFNLTSNPIRPALIPFNSSQSTVEDLQFSLKLMTSDWSSERASGVYLLGDVINLEASCRLDHYGNLRIFFESCVATVTPDFNSVPRYTFVEKPGCLMDGKLTGSKSRFLPRIQNDKLQMQLDAFKFQQEKRTEIYITCTLQVYPVMNEVNPVHKACSFADGSWSSADGDDWACYSCQKQNYAPSFRFKQEQFGPPAASITDQTSSTHRPSKFQPRIQNSSGRSSNILQTPSEPVLPSWRSIIDPQEEASGRSAGWEQEKTLGPLAIFPKTDMGFLAPPRVKEGVPHFPSPSKAKKPMPHSSLWKNGVTEEMDTEGDVTSLPTLEPTEHPNVTASEDDDEEDDYEEEDRNYNEEENGDVREAIEDMWKTKVLPENDLEELFTTPTSMTDEDYGVTAWSTSSSLLDDVEQTSTHHS